MSSLSSSPSSSLLTLLSQPKLLFYFVAAVLWFQILPVLAILCCPIYLVADLITHFLPKYGKFPSYLDLWMEEDYVSSIPRGSIITSLTINGDLSLEEFRSRFKTKVLEAVSTSNPEKNRYPELKQSLVTFMGFRIWKDDEHFAIENHIVDRTHDYTIKYAQEFIANIHQELMNLPYQKGRSPWEIVLIRNFENKKNSTLLACRFHHVMGDAKSLLKIFVECLGDKKLKMASPLEIKNTLVDKLLYYPLYLPKYFLHMSSITFALSKIHLHPWKVVEYWKHKNVKTIVAFSPKLQLGDVKNVAKRNGVTGSAVVIAIIAGAIRKFRDDFKESDVIVGYPLPKPDHPEGVTNHLYMGLLKVPVSVPDQSRRLKQCNENFNWMRYSQLGAYLNFATFVGGNVIFPFTRLSVNHFTPIGITNIAGEEVGFSMGKGEVVDFRMSVGTIGGVAGVVFSAFSYKDGIRIAINVKEHLMKKKDVEKLASDIGEELQLLKNSSSSSLKLT